MSILNELAGPTAVWAPSLIWIGIAVILGVIEAITLGLITIWFAAGALVAAIAALFHAPMPLQIVIFFVVSCVLLYFTKPLAQRKLKIGKEKTNVDALAGQTALVTENIRPYHTGQVKVNGQIWTAITDLSDLTIPAGIQVRIQGVEGVKLIVRPLEEEAL